MRAPGRREEDTSVRVLIWLPFIEGLQGPGRGASVGQVVHGGDPRHSAPPSQSIWQGPQRGRFLDVLLERGRGRRPLACCLSADGDQLPGAGQGRVRLRHGSRQGRESRAFISAHLGHTEQKQCIGLGSPAHCVPPQEGSAGTRVMAHHMPVYLPACRIRVSCRTSHPLCLLPLFWVCSCLWGMYLPAALRERKQPCGRYRRPGPSFCSLKALF